MRQKTLGVMFLLSTWTSVLNPACDDGPDGPDANGDGVGDDCDVCTDEGDGGRTYVVNFPQVQVSVEPIEDSSQNGSTEGDGGTIIDITKISESINISYYKNVKFKSDLQPVSPQQGRRPRDGHSKGYICPSSPATTKSSYESRQMCWESSCPSCWSSASRPLDSS